MHRSNQVKLPRSALFIVGEIRYIRFNRICRLDWILPCKVVRRSCHGREFTVPVRKKGRKEVRKKGRKKERKERKKERKKEGRKRVTPVLERSTTQYHRNTSHITCYSSLLSSLQQLFIVQELFQYLSSTYLSLSSTYRTVFMLAAPTPLGALLR